MPQIKRLTEVDIRTQALADLKEIFFLTSTRTLFASAAAKEQFFANWTNYYLTRQPEHVYLAFSEGGRLQGYLTGCPDSRKAIAFVNQGSLQLFSDLFKQFPAHFHINCHPSAQGKGVGSLLTEKFLEDLKASQCPGVHVVTSPQALNVGFYEKNGFTFKDERSLNGARLLFMGKSLQD